MVRRSTRGRSPPPKVLLLPTSACVIECYAIQGKGHHHRPLLDEVSELLLVNARQETCWVRNAGSYGGPYRTSAQRRPRENGLCSAGARVIEQPRELAGDFDRVDPEVADLHKLQRLNPPQSGSSSTPCVDATSLRP